MIFFMPISVPTLNLENRLKDAWTAEFVTAPKLYTPSTLNTEFIQWHTQVIMCAVKCKIMVKIIGYFYHYSTLYSDRYIELY